ncbi:hypothetical protein [Streptomyces cadmiisoli]|uniref:hypothetical protein n=1 Tax=Streptomyces cadmiisoli TaxID=2184053 RepID=UPI0036481958
MARSTHTVARTGHLGPAVIAALFAVLISLLSPPAYGSTHPHVPDGAMLTSASATQHHGGPHADDEHRAVLHSATTRSPGDTGERPSPPALAALAPSPTADGPPQPTSTPLPALPAPGPAQVADRHPMRAPPSSPGI